jgi:hypothetical protein
MRKGGGKAKGAQFERDVCKELSLWVSGHAREDLFWRSAMSGGRATVAGRKGKHLASQAGDISSVDPLGGNFISKFYVECKFYKDLDFRGLITGKGKLVEFWETTKTEALCYHKHPLLIAKQNKMPVLACLTRSGLAQLELNDRPIVTVPRMNLYIVLFHEDFLLVATAPR